MTEISADKIIEKLNWRYAVKAFDSSKKIPEATIESLKEILTLTPSSFGLQPWKFIFIEDAAIKKQLPAVSWNQTQPKDCSHMVALALKTSYSESDVDTFIGRMADVRDTTVDALAGYRDFAGGFVKKANVEGWVDTWSAHQTYIALGQLMMGAAMLEVDACPMEGIQPDAYDELLGLKERGYRTVVGCALGYRDSSDKYASAAKVRYEVGDIVEVV